MTKRIFVAATKQNDGKTTISLGLIFALAKWIKEIGFIKPVGQRYVETCDIKVDEDSVLVEQMCGIQCHVRDMSPIAIEHDFTRRYIREGNNEMFIRQINDSFQRVADGKDLVIIEGTGHAGVGSVFGLSNATVAKLLQAPVIMVAGGGIGRPIDEISLNRCLFEREGVGLLGVIVNKVIPEKLDMVNTYLGKALKQSGVDLLGVIPYEKVLASPTMKQILEETKGDLLNGEAALDNRIGKILIGAMSPHRAINYFTNDALVITPGDREDIILAALSSAIVGLDTKRPVSGLVLTGGIYPHNTIMKVIRKTEVPVILVEDDSYTAASRIYDLTIKTRPGEMEKVRMIRRLIEKWVDVDRILDKI